MRFDLHVLVEVFAVIFVAELPDKTALAALVLATRHKPWPVFFGSALALTVQSAIAVGAGRLVAMLPARPVHIGAGVVFLVSAIFMWRRKHDDDDDELDAKKTSESFFKAFAYVFGVVFVAEWGDLTQIGTAALAARFDQPLTVFVGASLALFSVAALAVFVGSIARKHLTPERTKKVAAVLFAGIGAALLVGAARGG